MARGKRASFKGHDPYNPKDLPIYPRQAYDWPSRVGHKHLRTLVGYWLAEHGLYDVPPDLVDKMVRYTFAAVRYFVDRDRAVVLKGMGQWRRKAFAGRSRLNLTTGERRPGRPYIDVRWRTSDDWSDDLTFAAFQRPRRQSGLRRARQRYYLRKLAEQGLLTPDIHDRALAKLDLTREQLLAAIAARHPHPQAIPTPPEPSHV